MKHPTKPRNPHFRYPKPEEYIDVPLYHWESVYGTSLKRMVEIATEVSERNNIEANLSDWMIHTENDCAALTYIGSHKVRTKVHNYKSQLDQWVRNERQINEWEEKNADRMKKYESQMEIYKAWLLKKKITEAENFLAQHKQIHKI